MILYYYPLCPLSQKIHWLLIIYKVDFVKVAILNKDDYQCIKNSLDFSPLPLLKIDDNTFLKESLVISDYLQYHYDNKKICFNTKNIETITDIHFYRDVYMNVVYERTLKNIFINQRTPNTHKIYEGLSFLMKYLSFFENLLTQYTWLNKFQFSAADISFFTQLMCLDYCSQVPWCNFPEIKKWYMRIKYRQDVKKLLQDHIVNFPPPKHYESLDF